MSAYKICFLPYVNNKAYVEKYLCTLITNKLLKDMKKSQWGNFDIPIR